MLASTSATWRNTVVNAPLSRVPQMVTGPTVFAFPPPTAGAKIRTPATASAPKTARSVIWNIESFFISLGEPEHEAVMVRARGKFSLKLEIRFLRKRERFFFRDDVRPLRAHATERFFPVNNGHPPARTQNSPRFAEKGRLVFDLEQHIRDEHQIDVFLAEPGAASLCEVPPDNINVRVAALSSLVADAPQKVALYVYRIHPPEAFKGFSNKEHVGAGARAEVGDMHPRVETEYLDIPRRTCNPRCMRRRSSVRRLHRVHYIPQWRDGLCFSPQPHIWTS